MRIIIALFALLIIYLLKALAFVVGVVCIGLSIWSCVTLIINPNIDNLVLYVAITTFVAAFGILCFYVLFRKHFKNRKQAREQKKYRQKLHRADYTIHFDNDILKWINMKYNKKG